MNKYFVTLSLVVDAINDEHAEECARQLAPNCGKVAVHSLGQTSPQAAVPLILDDMDPLGGTETGVDEVELQLKLTRQEAKLLFDLCAQQAEVLKNASINEGTDEFKPELAVLQKLLITLQRRLEE